MADVDNELDEFDDNDKVWNEIKDQKISAYENFSVEQLERLKSNIEFLLRMIRKHGDARGKGE